MVVQGRALAGTPGHDDGRVAEIIVAMEQPARVALGAHAEKALRQRDRIQTDRILELLLYPLRDCVRVAEPHRVIDPADKFAEPASHLIQYSERRRIEKNRTRSDWPRKHETRKELPARSA